MDLGFEGLIVLALDLEFGLEFFHQHFEACDFDTKFLEVGGGGRGTIWLLVLCRLTGLEIGRRRLLMLAGEAWNGPGSEGVG